MDKTEKNKRSPKTNRETRGGKQTSPIFLLLTVMALMAMAVVMGFVFRALTPKQEPEQVSLGEISEVSEESTFDPANIPIDPAWESADAEYWEDHDPEVGIYDPDEVYTGLEMSVLHRLSLPSAMKHFLTEEGYGDVEVVTVLKDSGHMRSGDAWFQVTLDKDPGKVLQVVCFEKTGGFRFEWEEN